MRRMSEFDSLTLALEPWFDTPLSGLPDAIRQRVEEEFFPIPWDDLSAEQRHSGTLQMDYQRDPATEQDRQFWWDFFERIAAIKKQIAEWGAVATPSATELALKETRLTDLKQELARMETQKRQARGDYFPTRRPVDSEQEPAPTSPDSPILYIAYPKAMGQLAKRLGATPEELAAWIWAGPEDGGIAAYLNANELDPPPRFHFSVGSEDHDYVSPLMACWFHADEIDQFTPADRYLTGKALIERWRDTPGLHAEAFIRTKIAESRLFDTHPIYGGTRGTFSEHADYPPLTSGLFLLSQVEQIEAEDFDKQNEREDSEVTTTENTKPDSDLGSPEWRSNAARTAANARHDQPGGSRDKQRQVQEIWASGKYSSRDLCAEQECAAIGMSFAAARRALVNQPEPSRC